MPNHRQVTVEIEERYCDAVCDILLEAGALGTSVEDDETRRGADKNAVATGRSTVVAPFALAPGLEAAVAAALSGLFTQLEPAPEASISWQDIVEQDWSQAWKERWKAQRIGQRLVVVPSWEQYQPLPDDIVLNMDPGMAFGTGTHETTQLCCQALETLCRPGCSLLDVGCGTGILALFGAKLGASRVLAVDRDADAIRAGSSNARSNHLEQVRFAATHNVGISGQFDIVVANILMAPLIELAQPIVSRLSDSGVLLLSGLLREQLDRVAKVYCARRLVETRRLTMGEWGLLQFTWRK